MREYEFRVIAFIDIIGFKSLIEKTKTDKDLLTNTIDAIEIIRKEFLPSKKSPFAQEAEEKLGINCDTQVFQLSDCLVVSKLADVPGAVEELVIECSFAIHLLISNGLLCRGFITLGSVLHNDEYLIGPAYTEAYLGEENEPFPAVSLSNEIYEFASQKRSEDWGYFEKYIVQHGKDRFFLDYFNDFSAFDVGESLLEHYQKLRNLIISEYSSATEEKIIKKYTWMINKFNNSNIVKNKILDSIELNC